MKRKCVFWSSRRFDDMFEFASTGDDRKYLMFMSPRLQRGEYHCVTSEVATLVEECRLKENTGKVKTHTREWQLEIVY